MEWRGITVLCSPGNKWVVSKSVLPFVISKAIPRLLVQAVVCPGVTGPRWCGGGLNPGTSVGARMCSGASGVRVDSHANSAGLVCP